MSSPYVRHRQPWTSEEVAKLRTLAAKGMGLKAIARALTRSEESVQDRAKVDRIKIAKLR
jgi:DNA-binding NarL/FixJ family response regulator